MRTKQLRLLAIAVLTTSISSCKKKCQECVTTTIVSSIKDNTRLSTDEKTTEDCDRSLVAYSLKNEDTDRDSVTIEHATYPQLHIKTEVVTKCQEI